MIPMNAMDLAKTSLKLFFDIEPIITEITILSIGSAGYLLTINFRRNLAETFYQKKSSVTNWLHHFRQNNAEPQIMQARA